MENVPWSHLVFLERASGIVALSVVIDIAGRERDSGGSLGQHSDHG